MLAAKQKRKRYNTIQGREEIKRLVDRLPEEDECFKFLTDGGFSSASFIAFVCEKTVVNRLKVSTFHIGKKEILTLNQLHKQGRLKHCEFTVFSFEKQKGDKYGYFSTLERICQQNGWDIRCKNNHSKVHLYDTESGKFVLETSSNLCENPKLEQFSFEKDESLYRFYQRNIFGVMEDED